MKQGKIHIYSGDGHGKTPAALGEALYAASEGKNSCCHPVFESRPSDECRISEASGAGDQVFPF